MKQSAGCEKKIQKKQKNLESNEKLKKILTSILFEAIQDAEKAKWLPNYYLATSFVEQEQSNNSESEKTICVRGQTQRDLAFQMFDLLKQLKFSSRVLQLHCAQKINKIRMMQYIRQDVLRKVTK